MSDERTTAKTERMKRTDAMKLPTIPVLVGSTAWVLHDDHQQGYEVSLHASEAGAHEAVLVRVQQLADEGEFNRDDNEDLFDALDAKDGRAVLKAFDAIVSEDGRDATGGVFLWITEQKVEA